MEAKDLARLVDDYVAAKDRRLALDKEAKAAKKREEELAARLIEEMQQAGTRSVGSNHYRLTRWTDDKPIVKDWASLYGYILDNEAFDLLHRRLSATAVKERTEVGENIPGLSTFPVDKLTVGKL